VLLSDVSGFESFTESFVTHKNKYLDEAVKQKDSRYAERCNAAGLNFKAFAFETSGAICMEVTPLIDATLRNSRISRSR
jgi:hypothetical protein